MIDIGVSHLVKRFSLDPVLRDVTFDLNKGEKVGIVGANGSGKTTLFRIITGEESADSGQVFLRKDCTTGYLQQNLQSLYSHSARDIIKQAFHELFSLEDKLKEKEKLLAIADNTKQQDLIKEYGKLQSEFEQKGGYLIDSELSRITSGLNLSDDLLNQKFELLSGGEKNRVMLAKILLESPDILLLDEPTNHLDIAASEWLESYLSGFEGTVLIISHDRYFLDRAVCSIIELENGRSSYFAGNYSYYVKEKERKLLAEFEQYKNIRKKIKAMKAAAERFRIWGRINPDNSAHFARAKRLEAKIEELESIDRPTQKPHFNRQFSDCKRSGKEVIKAENLCFSFAEKQLFDSCSFLLTFGEKLAFIGENGSGKSTFFKLARQTLQPETGIIRLGTSIKIGYLEQDIHFFDEQLTVLDAFRSEFPIGETEARNSLAGFLFKGEEVFKKISLLSGGEKVRLRLCFLMQQDLNFLLLDEPTNHLDIQSREMVEEALDNFSGTIFFISHDRYFINKIASSIVALETKTLKRYPGNYDYYRSQIESIPKMERVKPKPEIPCPHNKSRKANPLLIEKLENKISECEIKIAEIEEDIVKNATNYLKLMELTKEKEDMESTLENLLTEWEKLQRKS